ncbi:undecaprenyldiphospho-muramoylpentapeptide beta-N-acetylglucosaminyltransferase [Ancylothrix sp. C2]|uniref:undecaprenyldiphospho-muramoylpentapeptide beta-N-acetylglucosaminyltransferase n=1 Tax=Ancylothrix sp. D3o TaxID=2953691 RepID=UPI0021BB1A96|nr:undecaprenyldiphospho-muramoylpentapeptide beta-N-acetylglucosaminyltransferase [Ancylothrix sp. D3o]MCT7951474.1 undecaprenyldiphospho-muramoylpentapeptide beta-N-acetylglucosaminyltransferase [Ancylothrix sp. D3o]
MTTQPKKLLIAASGTGGHLFPALAVAEQLQDCEIQWLGVPDRLETQLVPKQYPLHSVPVEGFQTKGLGTVKVFAKLVSSVFTVRRLLKKGKFDGVFTTGGYIAAPAILAARSLGLPAILHDSNALPGKVTRWFSNFCTVVALGFEAASAYLPRVKTLYVGTPVRKQFLSVQKLNLPVPDNVPLIVVTGGSQGAVALNKLVRECAPAWFEQGAWIVHQTGENDPDAQSLQHPQYISLPLYDNMAGLFERADLAISRAGAGTLTELAATATPAILIPYPFAAEDHQAFNAAVFERAGAAVMCRQQQLTAEKLQSLVLDLLKSPERLQEMADKARSLAVPNSASRLAGLVREYLAN